MAMTDKNLFLQKASKKIAQCSSIHLVNMEHQ